MGGMCAVPGDLQGDPGVGWSAVGSDRWSRGGQPCHRFPCNHSDCHAGENNTEPNPNLLPRSHKGAP